MTDRIDPPEQREIDINDEMAQSFVDYAMSVIVSRALPDVRDGLKPVQRRIVYSMSENNMGPNTPHQKCAQVVGDVMGRYHPHNQDAIYEALVRMGQTFSLRHLLIDPQGNFGTVDDPAGAMRYCVTGDTLIRTSTGTRRIDSLATLEPNSEIDLDLKVIGRDGSPVRATKLFHSGVHPVMRLDTEEGHHLIGTANHPVLTLAPVEGVPLLLWRLMSELRPGDTVVMSRVAADEPRLSKHAGSRDRIPYVSGYIREGASRGWREWLARHELSSAEVWGRHGEELLGRIGNPEVRSVVAPLVAGQYYFANVAGVRPAGAEVVYSLRVDSEDHAFVTNGFISHNTECRLAELSLRLLDGIDESTVDFEPNYAGNRMQPTVLPARFPNLLVNGAQGIAVGMATNIPPHNLGEVIGAAVHALDHPDATSEDLLRFVKGPDFPTGGYIVGTSGIRDALLTGRGSVKMRAVADVQEIRKGRVAIVVTETPYQVSHDRVMLKIADLVNDKKVAGIADVRNESSDRVGTRLVIELKKDAVPQVVINQLYKNTQLQETFGVNMVALVDSVPRTLGLAEMIGHYLDHQMEVIERRTRHRLEKAREREHIVEGLIVAVDNIDEVVQVIRSSSDTPEARDRLMERFALSEIQAREILDMPLRRLTALETEKLRQELEELRALIADLEAILADPGRRRAIIKEDLIAVRERFGEPRRTRIIPDEGELSLEDLIADDELIVTVSDSGYLKSVPTSTYRVQGRGGRGIRGAEVSRDDVVAQLVHTTAHAYLLFFTNQGRVHRIKAHAIPRQSRTAKGVLAQSVLPLEPDERIQSVVDTRDYETSRFLVMVTRQGLAKKTTFREYDSRNTTLVAINLQEGDELVDIHATNGENDLLIFTRLGMGIRFSESELRPMGRATQGVRAIKLREGDEVVAATSDADGDEVLLLTTGGYGKRTRMEHLRPQHRGGIGLIAIKPTRVRGDLIAAKAVRPGSEIVAVSSGGVVIRTVVDSISRQQRAAGGVRVMALPPGSTLAAVTLVPPEEAE